MCIWQESIPAVVATRGRGVGFRRGPGGRGKVTGAERFHLQIVLWKERSHNGDQMDWNRVEGNWKQMKGKLKEKWGNLTDDDLTVVNGKRDQLEGKIQERYGLAKDQVRKESTTGTIRRLGSTRPTNLHAEQNPRNALGGLLD